MKKLLLLLLLSSISMHGLEAAAGQATDEECKVDDLRDVFLRLSLNGAAARAAGAPVGAPLPATLLDKSMAPRFGAVAIRSVTGRLPRSVRERFLREARAASSTKLRELGWRDADRTFTLTTEADVEQAERVIDRLPMVFSLRLKKKSVQRFDASLLREEIAPYLEELDLRCCELREVPAWVGGIAGLRKLVFYKNSDITIPDDFVFPAGLEELDLGSCGLREMPAGIAGIPGLKKLDLGDNNGIQIPDDFVFPAALEQLRLSYCGLRKMPAWVAGIAGLKELGLEYNGGITIPDDFVFPVGLEELDLRLCGLREVPVGVAHSAGLKKLNLSGNEGITIPGWLQARVNARLTKVIQ